MDEIWAFILYGVLSSKRLHRPRSLVWIKSGWEKKSLKVWKFKEKFEKSEKLREGLSLKESPKVWIDLTAGKIKIKSS